MATWLVATTPSASASGSTWAVRTWKSCRAKRRAGSARFVGREAGYMVLVAEVAPEVVLVVEERGAEDGDGVID